MDAPGLVECRVEVWDPFASLPTFTLRRLIFPLDGLVLPFAGWVNGRNKRGQAGAAAIGVLSTVQVV